METVKVLFLYCKSLHMDQCWINDSKSNRCMRTIEDAHPHFVACMTMHHTLPIMISGGVDNSVKCWQLD